MSTVRHPLDRRRVVDAAISLADHDGLDATTMRRLAERLGVTPMALYKHIGSREELIDRMVDRLIEGIPASETVDDWRRTLTARILMTRAVVRAHPWAQDAIETRTLASPVILGYMDSLMAIMFAGGLSADLVHHGMHALSTRMWGFTREVMPTPSVPEDPAALEATLAVFRSDYPAIVRMTTTAPHAGAACDDDAEFAFALELLLEGLERRRLAGWTSSTD
ncbi:TetR/AcrR family transcriptional regulator [Microbacterium hydrocarbonoxydans]|uniref:TetR/AcrR family transcriptional regulator n=1 Tax=Microbacterium hydrocarbonoxydans TaxID=273678 RepID=UPI0005ED29CA|nr:TetR/AcrR family transcriptional regulator C-terminal domain-containing protein [Microbacterium hydrocarbonoxydans]